MEQQLPWGWTPVDTRPAAKIVIRSGHVYLTEEDGSLYYCGVHVPEPSNHEWVGSSTVKSDGSERKEFFEWSALLVDRMSENEMLGLSSRLEDERYMEIGRNEVRHKCGYVIPSGVPCGWCE